MKKSKNMLNATEKIDSMKSYLLEEAVALVKDMKYSKFDESVDLAIKLGVDPRHVKKISELQHHFLMVQVNQLKCLVLQGQRKEAQEAGADFVGNKDFLTKN